MNQIKTPDHPVTCVKRNCRTKTLTAADVFHKGLANFAGAELNGLLQGRLKPVIVMSGSESIISKFYCIALSVFIADHSI
ncbi:MAG: hypothetical protein GXO83_00840 [Chlorobi bacterium]|nr:hypothetical protein [Chlorobiota bacterium]